MIYRVLVTGSRNLDDPTGLYGALIDVWHDATQLGGHLVVAHGECYPPPDGNGLRPGRSADWLTHLWCVAHGVEDEPHPAAWGECSSLCPDRPHRKTRRDDTEYCPVAGHARNQELVDAGAHLCIAAPVGASAGTRDCMRRARAAEIEVVEVET